MIQRINDNNYNVYTKPKNLNIPETGEKFNLNDTHDGTSPETKDKGEVSDSKGQRTTEQGGVRLELSSDGRNADSRRQQSEKSAEAQNTAAPKPLLETIRAYVVSAIKAVQKFFHDIWYDQSAESSETASQEPLLITAQEILSDATQDSPADGFPDTMQDSQTDDFPGVAQDSVMESFPDILPNSLQDGFPDILQNTAREIPPRTAKEISGITDVPDEEETFTAYEARRERMILQLLSEGKREQALNLLTENGKRTVARNSTLLTNYDKKGRVVETNSSDRERTLHGDRNTWKL